MDHHCKTQSESFEIIGIVWCSFRVQMIPIFPIRGFDKLSTTQECPIANFILDEINSAINANANTWNAFDCIVGS